jgi:hypothetical protein
MGRNTQQGKIESQSLTQIDRGGMQLLPAYHRPKIELVAGSAAAKNNGKRAGRDSQKSSGSLAKSNRGRGRAPAIDRPAARSARSRSDQELAPEVPGGELLESPRQALQRSLKRD